MDVDDSREPGELLMSVDPDTDIASDEPHQVVLDRSRVHLFDTKTGEAILHGIVDPTETPREEEAVISETESDS